MLTYCFKYNISPRCWSNYPLVIDVSAYIRSELWPTLQWRHNGRDGFSNHRRLGCLLNRLFRRRSNKISKLRVTGLCEGNPPATGGFPAQRSSNAKDSNAEGSTWRHHVSGIHQLSSKLFSWSIYPSGSCCLFFGDKPIFTLNLLSTYIEMAQVVGIPSREYLIH